jgi:hypothetical protein
MLLARATEAVLGKGAFGLGAFSRLEANTPNRALLVVLMIGLRRTWTATERRNRDALVEALQRSTPELDAAVRGKVTFDGELLEGPELGAEPNS